MEIRPAVPLNTGSHCQLLSADQVLTEGRGNILQIIKALTVLSTSHLWSQLLLKWAYEPGTIFKTIWQESRLKIIEMWLLAQDPVSGKRQVKDPNTGEFDSGSKLWTAITLPP